MPPALGSLNRLQGISDEKVRVDVVLKAVQVGATQRMEGPDLRTN